MTPLRFDLYQPVGDTSTARPLLIWIHGGGFSTGNKTWGELVDLSNHFGRRGYVSASISYRLAQPGCSVPDAACVEAIRDAAEDAQAAVRYFRANAATYGIDPTRIAIGGLSAGAITALHVGFRLDAAETSGTPGVSSEVRGVMALSGLNVLAGIEDGDAKSLMFHGTDDDLTPLSAAESTSAQSNDAGVRSYLVTWDGAGHIPYWAHRDEILLKTRNFLYHVLDVANIA